MLHAIYLRELIDNFSFINFNKMNLFSYWLVHSSNSVMLVFFSSFFSFSYLFLVIQNVIKVKARRKFRNQEASGDFLTRSLLAKSGGLSALLVTVDKRQSNISLSFKF